VRPFREHLEAPSQSSFRCFARSADGFPFAWHCHRDFELTLITAGRGTRYVGDRVERYRAPDLALVGPDLPHTWEAPPGRRQRAVVVQFSQEWAARLAGLPEWAPVRDLLARAARGVAFSGATLAGAARALARLPRLEPHERLGRLIAILAGLARAPRDARTLSGTDPAHPEPARERRFEAVQRFLAERANHGVTQAATARHAGMAPAAFSRWFKRATGRTFVTHLRELRISAACRLLIESERSITDIAHAAGFENLSYFNRCFRRQRGLTPRAYRAQYRERERAGR
jgi:AraC-like DNA-binding protein